MDHPADWLEKLAILAIVGLVLVLRLRQVGRDRPLKLERLWIVPSLYGAVAVTAFCYMPPHGMVWGWCAVALVLGALLGWYRGKLVAISVDPETHDLNQRTSPAAMLFILAMVAIRIGARTLAVEMGVGTIMLAALTDVLIAFALGFLSVQRLEMGLRAARLLRQGRT